MTRSQADTITFDGRRATGVQITRNGRQSTVRARREILICAGTVGSAALLLRSGIGPGAPLPALGITSRHDLPGVGHNLQEPPGGVQNKFINRPSTNSPMPPLDLLRLARASLFGTHA